MRTLTFQFTGNTRSRRAVEDAVRSAVPPIPVALDDPGFCSHFSPRRNFDDIRQHGLMPRGDPDNMPTNAPGVWLAPSLDTCRWIWVNIAVMAAKRGHLIDLPDFYRVAGASVRVTWMDDDDGVVEGISTRAIPPRDLQVLRDGQWVPLSEARENPGKSGPLARRRAAGHSRAASIKRRTTRK